MLKHRTFVIIALATGACVLTTSCSQKYSAERDGKKLGEAICDLHEAETEDDANDALSEINEQLDDLGNKLALYTAEDRADINNNLADLAEHRIQGQPNLAFQDLTVLERSIKNVSEDVNETSRAAWEGVLQGLADCTQ